MDLLADVLTVAGVRGTVAATVAAGGTWGFELEPIQGAAFHAVTAGTAWLRTGGRPAQQLLPGDVVLFPTGAAHALSSERKSRLTPWAHLASGPAYENTRAIEVGSMPARTRILCASYRHDPVVTTPLFTLLPEVLHVPADTLSPSLSDTVRLMATEIASHELAATTVLDKLVDVVLIHLLRGWLRTEPSAAPLSWLRGLADETVTAALVAMHADPARAWTADALAAEVAVSRSTLIRRFTALVGEPPTAYLTRWRMDLAACRLRDTDKPVDVIGRSVGYRSVYAFSRAFARERSASPARYRAVSRAQQADPHAHIGEDRLE